jgi:para-aminobenzoate synthetase / 4-amino-4-deoxychorismate lyase
MRVSASAEVYLLDRHLERLRRSADFFSFECDLDTVRGAILQAIPRNGQAVCLRLQLAKSGETSLELHPLPVSYARFLKLSSVVVDSRDVFLYHKTTNRGVYERARQDCDDQTDVVLVNECGYATETTVMNIAVFREGRWITPSISCGLLPGTMREELLASGELVEGIVPARELQSGEVIRCFNALRGVFDVRFL